MSFPPGTEIFQFPGFASTPYVFRCKYSLRSGFPHSEISGSKFVRNSPELFAAYHVLHRLCAPRHPPDALKTLDLSVSTRRRHHNPCFILTNKTIIIQPASQTTLYLRSFIQTLNAQLHHTGQPGHAHCFVISITTN
jgi:hypothetical protein